MTTLVERLRQSVTKGHEPTDDLAIEAADEIERLRGLYDDCINEIHRLNRLGVERGTEIETWKDRYETERRDHETTIRYCDKIMSSEP